MEELEEIFAQCGIDFDINELHEFELPVYQLLPKLEKLDPDSVVLDVEALISDLPLGRKAWIRVGHFLFRRKEYEGALVVFEGLFDYLSSPKCEGFTHANRSKTNRIVPYKGDALLNIGHCNRMLGRNYLANRAIVLSVIEDLATNTPENGYWEEVGFESNSELLKLGFSITEREALRNKLKDSVSKVPTALKNFPEYVLQIVDDYGWLKHFPRDGELLLYSPNRHYVKTLLELVNQKETQQDGSEKFPGKPMERLAQYLFQLIPGCRAFMRKLTYETDFDVWCQFDGVMADFRKEVGHYCIVECKNWNKTVGFSEVAKFALVLISANCKFGVIFSRKGISSGSGFEDAARAVLKLYQNAGVVVVSINENHLSRVVKGESFIEILRQEYEKVRFDLSSTKGKD